jgi:hypothetical protein
VLQDSRSQSAALSAISRTQALAPEASSTRACPAAPPPPPTHPLVSATLSFSLALTTTSAVRILPQSFFLGPDCVVVGKLGCCRPAPLTAHSRHLHIFRLLGLTTAFTTSRCNHRHRRHTPSITTRRARRLCRTRNPRPRFTCAENTTIRHWAAG